MNTVHVNHLIVFFHIYYQNTKISFKDQRVLYSKNNKLKLNIELHVLKKFFFFGRIHQEVITQKYFNE